MAMGVYSIIEPKPTRYPRPLARTSWNVIVDIIIDDVDDDDVDDDVVDDDTVTSKTESSELKVSFTTISLQRENEAIAVGRRNVDASLSE